jgi:hypothetical protein
MVCSMYVVSCTALGSLALTPILVVRYGLLQQNPSPTQAQIVEHLDGNLCRCTGYRPIVAAFTSFGSDYVDVPKQSGGKCCGSIRSTIPGTCDWLFFFSVS